MKIEEKILAFGVTFILAFFVGVGISKLFYTSEINTKLDTIQAEVHQIKEASGIYDKENP